MLVATCARLRGMVPLATKPALPTGDTPKQGIPGVIGGGLLGLFIDNAWRAVGIVVSVLLAWFFEARQLLVPQGAALLFTAGLAVVLAASAVRRAKH